MPYPLYLVPLSFRDHLINYQNLVLDGKYKPANVALYRNLQILALLMNEEQKWGITANLAFLSIIAQAGSVSGIILISWNAENITGIVFLLLQLSTAANNLFGTFGSQSSILGVTEVLIKNLNSSERSCNGDRGNRLDRKWRHRFFKSCKPIRVGFGSINFVDALTPLTCVDMGNNMAANFVMMK